MSSTSDPRIKYANSQGLGERNSYHESTINPGQHLSADARTYSQRKPPPDRLNRDEAYPRAYDTRTQAQRWPNTTSPEDETNRLSSTDRSRYSDHEPRRASIRSDSIPKFGKDAYKGRSRPHQEANPPRGEDNNFKGLFLKAGLKKIIQYPGMLENYDDEYMPSDEHEMKSEARIHSLQQGIRSLETQVDSHTRTIVELRNDLRVEAENSKMIKESANKMAYALESKDPYVGRQASDDTVYSQFQNLIGKIKTWSIPFAQDHPATHLEFAPEIIEEFRRVAPIVIDLPRFLQTPKNMRLLVRGYVSMTIAERLFRTLPTANYAGSGGKDIWMDVELADGVFLVENHLLYAGQKLIADREFHDWRALTTTLIAKLDGTSSKTGKGMESSIAQCSNQIMSVVGRWVAPESRGALEGGLFAVLIQAVRLSQTLRCQRAYWSVRHLGNVIQRKPQPGWPDDFVLFDEATMEDNDGDEGSDEEGARVQDGKTVEVFVTPGLFKSGNSDGERFDIETCVERSEVKCRTLPIRHGHPEI